MSINAELLYDQALYHMCYQDLIKIILFTPNKGQWCNCLLNEVIDFIQCDCIMIVITNNHTVCMLHNDINNTQ